jgi:hypothetical protein
MATMTATKFQIEFSASPVLDVDLGMAADIARA